jgi:ElaB/YqjD/DUF883 family membrane-anchored ribosome-binding protein
MADIGSYAVVVAFLAGSVRALLLWRASTSVEVVNVVVLETLAEGHGASLEKLLRGSGSALYLEVATAIGRAALSLPTSNGESRDARKELQHVAREAIQNAAMRVRRSAWLDVIALAAIGYAGVDAATRSSATPFKAVAMAAATLLWFANLQTARHIATRVYAGANALIESLLASFDRNEGFAAPKNPEDAVSA